MSGRAAWKCEIVQNNVVHFINDISCITDHERVCQDVSVLQTAYYFLDMPFNNAGP